MTVKLRGFSVGCLRRFKYEGTRNETRWPLKTSLYPLKCDDQKNREIGYATVSNISYLQLKLSRGSRMKPGYGGIIFPTKVDATWNWENVSDPCRNVLNRDAEAIC
jgi:hypothetical protein